MIDWEIILKIILGIILGLAIILVCFLLQVKYYASVKKKIAIYKDIYPNSNEIKKFRVNFKVDPVSGMQTLLGIKSQKNDNSVYKVIEGSINNYLCKLNGGIADFNIIKDIADRNSDSLEDEIDSQLPLPINIGLMGTMLGIVYGVLSLVLSGTLKGLVSGETDVSGISSLLGGVGVAMLTSISGIIFTTILTNKVKEAKSETEKEKNLFLSWIQANLLPALSTDISAVIEKMTINLSGFNNIFSQNALILKDALSKVSETTKYQTDLLDTLKEVDLVKMAKANVLVYNGLKNSTEEIAKVTAVLENSSNYLARVNEVNEKLDDVNDRTKAMEQMVSFFKSERTALANSSNFVLEALRRVDTSILAFQDAMKQQIGDLSNYALVQHDNYKKYLDEESAALHSRCAELNAIISDLKNLADLKNSISKFESSITAQNRKIDDLTKSIKELAACKTDNVPTRGLFMPKWFKIVIIVAVGLIILCSILFLVINIIDLFN